MPSAEPDPRAWGRAVAAAVRAFLLALPALALLPQGAVAAGKIYGGVAMFNPNYHDADGDHRSTGLLGRAGYDITPRLAVEAHAAASIGSQSGADPDVVQAQMTELYGGYLRFNTQLRYARVYALGGLTYGSRQIAQPENGPVFTDNDSNKSYGLGVEVADDPAFAFNLEWIRYFSNRYYDLDAWNLGIVVRF